MKRIAQQDFGQHVWKLYTILSTGEFPRNSLQLKCLEEDSHIGGREKRGDLGVFSGDWHSGRWGTSISVDAALS